MDVNVSSTGPVAVNKRSPQQVTEPSLNPQV